MHSSAFRVRSTLAIVLLAGSVSACSEDATPTTRAPPTPTPPLEQVGVRFSQPGESILFENDSLIVQAELYAPSTGISAGAVKFFQSDARRAHFELINRLTYSVIKAKPLRANEVFVGTIHYDLNGTPQPFTFMIRPDQPTLSLSVTPDMLYEGEPATVRMRGTYQTGQRVAPADLRLRLEANTAGAAIDGETLTMPNAGSAVLLLHGPRGATVATALAVAPNPVVSATSTLGDSMTLFLGSPYAIAVTAARASGASAAALATLTAADPSVIAISAGEKAGRFVLTPRQPGTTRVLLSVAGFEQESVITVVDAPPPGAKAPTILHAVQPLKKPTR